MPRVKSPSLTLRVSFETASRIGETTGKQTLPPVGKFPDRDVSRDSIHAAESSEFKASFLKESTGR